jgi:hypothetical protein
MMGNLNLQILPLPDSRGVSQTSPTSDHRDALQALGTIHEVQRNTAIFFFFFLACLSETNPLGVEGEGHNSWEAPTLGRGALGNRPAVYFKAFVLRCTLWGKGQGS